MFNSFSLNENDDDIFDDSKSLGDNQSQNDTSNQPDKDLLKNIQSSFTVNEDSEISDFINFLSKEADFSINIRYEFISSFYESLHRWFYKYNVDKTSYATAKVLSVLTENKYMIYYRINELRIEIIKRKVISKFIRMILENTHVLSKLFEKLNSELDRRYIKTYLVSIYEMNEFTIVQSTALYKALCESIDIEFDPSYLDQEKHTVSSFKDRDRKENLFRESLDPETRELIASHMKVEIQAYEDKLKNEKGNN